MTGALILLAGAAMAWRTPARAAQTAPTRQATGSIQGNVEHGRYIVHDVAMCVECHSPRDAQGNIVAGQEFYGAPVPVGAPSWASDWALVAPRNRNLPGYDDQQAMRLLTEGAIGRDGKQLRPPMPRFHMTKQDAADVIAYLRSVQ
jgi:mono/diheme cytochrome c family protein